MRSYLRSRSAVVAALPVCWGIAHADPESDWLARSTAPGVTMATNFSESNDVFDFAEDDPSHYEHEQNIKLSGGGSLKILMPDSDTHSGHDWWRFLDDAKAPFGSAESGLRDEYWLSYSVYLPDDYYDWIFEMTTSGGKKFSITSTHPQDSRDPITREIVTFPRGEDGRNGSSSANELVIDDSNQSMMMRIYIRNIDGNASTQNRFPVGSDVCGNSLDYYYTNTTDLGPQSGTPLAFPEDQRSQACRDWTAQFGQTWSYALSTVHSGHSWPVHGQRRSMQAQPHPDPIAAGKHFNPGWNTILYHIKFPTEWETRNGTLEAWMWHPGDSDWTKVFERFDIVGRNPMAVNNGIALNGGTDGYFHWGLWLTPFRTGGQAEIGVRPNTFIIYDEVIVSTNPIAAPNTVRPNPPGSLVSD